jgi:hypothetical protein
MPSLSLSQPGESPQSRPFASSWYPRSYSWDYSPQSQPSVATSAIHMLPMYRRRRGPELWCRTVIVLTDPLQFFWVIGKRAGDWSEDQRIIRICIHMCLPVIWCKPVMYHFHFTFSCMEQWTVTELHLYICCSSFCLRLIFHLYKYFLAKAYVYHWYCNV